MIILILEKSCGAVIMRKTPQKSTEVLLVKMQNGGHYSFPKGHVEGNETEHETARREIAEEVSLEVNFLDGFRETNGYSPKEGVYKDVIYFAAVPSGGSLKRQEEEITDTAWYAPQEALELVTYENDKKILQKALDFFNDHEGGQNNA